MKKTILVIVLSLGVLGLAVVAFLTATQLQKIGTQPIAPTSQQPAAAGAGPNICTFDFTIAVASPSPSPSPSVSPSPSPSTSPSPSPSRSPSPSPSRSPSPSPNLASCGNGCSVDIDCAGSLICVNQKCVNPQCTADADCVCGSAPARTPTPTPEETTEVELPEAGISLPTIGLLGAGLTALLLGALVLMW